MKLVNCGSGVVDLNRPVPTLAAPGPVPYGAKHRAICLAWECRGTSCARRALEGWWSVVVRAA